MNSFISGQQSFNRQRSENEAAACRRFFDPEKCAKEIFSQETLLLDLSRGYSIIKQKRSGRTDDQMVSDERGARD